MCRKRYSVAMSGVSGTGYGSNDGSRHEQGCYFDATLFGLLKWRNKMGELEEKILEI